MAIHKEVPVVTMWKTPALCGAYPVVTVTNKKWGKVTCKNCLRLRRTESRGQREGK